MGILSRRLRPLAYGAVAAGLNLVAVAATPAVAEVTVTAFGDSLTQGYGLPPEDGFVAQLSRWIEAQGVDDVTLVNAGVSGDTTTGGLARLDWTLANTPDAVIVELGANDALRGIDPALTRDNLSQIVAGIRDRDIPVLLVGISAIGNYGQEYRDAFAAIYPGIAEEQGVALYPDFFATLLDGSTPAEARELWFQEDGIHPDSDGVARIVEDIGPVILDLIDAARTMATN